MDIPSSKKRSDLPRHSLANRSKSSNAKVRLLSRFGMGPKRTDPESAPSIASLTVNGLSSATPEHFDQVLKSPISDTARAHSRFRSFVSSSRVKYQCPRRYVSELSLSGRKWLGSLCSRVAEIFFFSNDEHHFLQCGGELGLSGLKGIEWFRGILDVIEGQDIDKKTISVRNTTMGVLQTGPNTSSPVNISNAFRTVWVGIRLYLTRSSL